MSCTSASLVRTTRVLETCAGTADSAGHCLDCLVRTKDALGPASAVSAWHHRTASGWAWAAVMLLVVLVLSDLALLPVPPEVVAQTTTATTAMGFLAMALRAPMDVPVRRRRLPAGGGGEGR